MRTEKKKGGRWGRREDTSKVSKSNLGQGRSLLGGPGGPKTTLHARAAELSPARRRESQSLPTPHARNTTASPTAARFLSRFSERGRQASSVRRNTLPTGAPRRPRPAPRQRPALPRGRRQPRSSPSSPALLTPALSRGGRCGASPTARQRLKVPGPGRRRPSARRLPPQGQARAGVSIASSTPLGNSPPRRTQTPLPLSNFRRQVLSVQKPSGLRPLLHHAGPSPPSPSHSRRNPFASPEGARRPSASSASSARGGAARAPPGGARLFPCAAAAHSALGGAGWLPGCGSSVGGGCCCLWPGRQGEAECW